MNKQFMLSSVSSYLPTHPLCTDQFCQFNGSSSPATFSFNLRSLQTNNIMDPHPHRSLILSCDNIRQLTLPYKWSFEETEYQKIVGSDPGARY